MEEEDKEKEEMKEKWREVLRRAEGGEKMRRKINSVPDTKVRVWKGKSKSKSKSKFNSFIIITIRLNCFEKHFDMIYEPIN